MVFKERTQKWRDPSCFNCTYFDPLAGLALRSNMDLHVNTTNESNYLTAEVKKVSWPTPAVRSVKIDWRRETFQIRAESKKEREESFHQRLRTRWMCSCSSFVWLLPFLYAWVFVYVCVCVVALLICKQLGTKKTVKKLIYFYSCTTSKR